jgi:hypothetical protein
MNGRPVRPFCVVGRPRSRLALRVAQSTRMTQQRFSYENLNIALEPTPKATLAHAAD